MPPGVHRALEGAAMPGARRWEAAARIVRSRRRASGRIDRWAGALAAPVTTLVPMEERVLRRLCYCY